VHVFVSLHLHVHDRRDLAAVGAREIVRSITQRVLGRVEQGCVSSSTSTST